MQLPSECDFLQCYRRKNGIPAVSIEDGRTAGQGNPVDRYRRKNGHRRILGIGDGYILEHIPVGILRGIPVGEDSRLVESGLIDVYLSENRRKIVY